MSDNDMIRRGDAVVAAQACPDSHWGPQIAAAIAALPAVTVGVRPLVWEPTDAQVASACMSYRHDFGLMGAEERKLQMFKAREWLRAWQKESAALPAVTPAPDAAALVDQVRFLAERLREWEGDYINHDEAGTQWIGNVIPPLVRLEAILALLPKGGA